jgi:hypothetical protein
VAETVREAQTSGTLAHSKESHIKSLKRFGAELGKQLWDLANTRRGRALYAILLTESDAIPITLAAKTSETATLNGSGVTQPIFNAFRSAGSATDSALRSSLNGITPHSGTGAVNALHTLIQSLGGPAQASTDITIASALAIDYVVYFLGMTAIVKGANRYLRGHGRRTDASRLASD